MANTHAQDRSLGELFAELSRETSDLVHHEVALAKAELSETAARVGRDVAFISIGGALTYAGLLALMAALVMGLAAAGLEWWAAALIVGLLIVTVGYISTQMGLSALKREQLRPAQTVDTLKENARWAKGQMH